MNRLSSTIVLSLALFGCGTDIDPADADDLAALADRVETLEAQLAAGTGDGFEALDTRVTALESGLSASDANIAALDVSMEAAEGSIATLTTAVAAVETDVGTIETDVATLQTDLDGLQVDVTALETGLTAVEGDVTSLETDLTAVEGDVTSLETDLTALQSTVTTIGGNVTTLQGDVVTLAGDITTLEGDIVSIQQDITDLFAQSGGALTASGTILFDGTPPSTSTTLDLSSVVGAASTLALLEVYYPSGTGDGVVFFRSSGTATIENNSTSAAGGRIREAGIGLFVVTTASDGTLKWNFSDYTGSSSVRVRLVSYEQ